jgi:hypothetical protein
VHYVVDRGNLIVSVDDSWDASAVQQPDAREAPTSGRIIGRPLEAFLAGDSTKMFVRAALEAARLTGESRRLPYRCDSPHERRLFHMIVTPLQDGHVKVEHVLVEVLLRTPCQPRAKLVLSTGWRCSQCLRIRPLGSKDWVEGELDPNAQLSHDVCASCARRLFVSGTLMSDESEPPVPSH